MHIDTKDVLPLLDSIKIDKYYIVCHFKCRVKNKTIISTLPFEPYHGKIEIKFKDIVFHPIKSYKKYYHTPIIIFNSSSKETIVLKAFYKVSKYFKWDYDLQKFIFDKR